LVLFILSHFIFRIFPTTLCTKFCIMGKQITRTLRRHIYWTRKRKQNQLSRKNAKYLHHLS
jgi:hypothetical protein